jgi:hypothetical protein
MPEQQLSLQNEGTEIAQMLVHSPPRVRRKSDEHVDETSRFVDRKDIDLRTDRFNRLPRHITVVIEISVHRSLYLQKVYSWGS